MTDIPNDDTPGADRDGPQSPDRAEAWQPATDAGSAKDLAQDAQTGHSRGRSAPSGDATLKRKAAAPVAPPQVEEGSAEPSDETPPDTNAGFAGERIAKAIARAGLASRRDAEAMILDGRVSVNGTVIDSPALNVTDDDAIFVDGEPLPTRERTRLWIFHKPRGLVTTARDPEGRQTVFEVLPEDMPRVVAIGRLDINTEGLLLLTNDGGLAKVIAHPDTGWLRRYRVRAHGDTDQAQLDRLAKGVTIDGMEYGPIEATLDRVQGDNLWLTLGLREGKNREVKRILEHLGLQVNRLIRMSFGPFQLGDLEVGLVEEVRTRVLKDQLGKSLSEAAGVDFESPTREPISPFGGPAKAAGSDGQQGKRQERRAPARPAPQRVSTGGTGAGPRRSVWREEGPAQEQGAYKPGRPPRRGADPRIDQAASAAERGRERVGAIKSGDRRVLVERLSPSPARPQAEEQPRRRYSKAAPGRPDGDGGGYQGRREGAPARTTEFRRDERPARSQDQRGAGRPQGARPRDDSQGGNWRGQRDAGPRREGGAPPQARSNERSDFGGGERRNPRQESGSAGPQRGRSDAGEGYKGRSGTPGKSFGDRPGGKSFGDRPGGKSFGDRPAGKSFGDRPGGKSFGDRPGGKSFGDRPGGKSFGGGKPGGGFKSGGGFKPGGSRPGGGGGKPGGARPPRGTR
ncbi:pseudouridine synthase [Methylobacterium sp. J-076]|uniref:pseudouridine synthase n=1 Tax=Methylobacterium sp. J-076 TaxID=2836655 RepID=UPI001FB88D59|nr:pseudouridine synthase [Methylobacterium sp. J-076]MCJ2015674.1 pseudouridine synthase [Methylobacterium sp. J-076]